MNLSERKVVLFDFDGTVADTVGGILTTARTVLTEFGMPEERFDLLPQIVGPPFPQAWVQVFGVTPSEADWITARYREIYEQLGPETYTVYPGMEACLAHLKAAGKTLAIASSKREPLVTKMLAGKGLSQYFSLVIGQRDSEHSSKPWVISEALRQLKAEPSEAVMVGDRFYDIEGAAEVGLPAVGVLFGTAPREELEQAGAAAIATTAEELEQILIC